MVWIYSASLSRVYRAYKDVSEPLFFLVFHDSFLFSIFPPGFESFNLFSFFVLSILLSTMGAAGSGWSNEAIKKVPAPARRAYIWFAAIWASYCGGLHGFNTANISGTMSLKPFKRDFGWNNLSSSMVSNYSGWVVSSMLLVWHPIYRTATEKQTLKANSTMFFY